MMFGPLPELGEVPEPVELGFPEAGDDPYAPGFPNTLGLPNPPFPEGFEPLPDPGMRGEPELLVGPPVGLPDGLPAGLPHELPDGPNPLDRFGPLHGLTPEGEPLG